MTLTFDTLNPLKQVEDFISYLPAVGIFFTTHRVAVVEGFASAILRNDASDQREDATWTRSLSTPQKVQVLKDYGKVCSRGAISGVATIALFIALTVLGLCPLGVGAVYCILGTGAIGIGAVQIYHINKFIRAQSMP